jgi:hypothetical protein
MQHRNARQSDESQATPRSRHTESDRVVRLSVNLNPESADTIKEYAHRKGISITEAIRRAIGALHFLDESQANGASVMINQKGELKEVILLV